MMLLIQVTPFVIVSIIAASAVLSHCFDDNLLQRVGLSATSIGATLTAVVLLRGLPELTNAVTLLAYGVVIYGAGTWLKVRRHK